MNRRFSLLLGVILILMGVISLAFSLVGPVFGWSLWRLGTWRLWPLFVISAGLLFVLSPLFVRGKPGLGGLFIPGMPVLITGGILLFTSVFNAWGAWEWLWPLEVLAVAAGFLFAAIYMRNVWLLIPAIIIGANGLLMQFCAITGWWEIWAVLWTIEPFSVGLALLVAYLAHRKSGLLVAGLILCGFAAFGLMGMTAIMPRWWFLNLIGPAVLIGIGLAVLLTNLGARASATKVAAPVPQVVAPVAAQEAGIEE